MVTAVARPRWTPDTATDEQQQLIEAVRHAFNQADQWERGGLAAILAAQQAKVPMTYLVGLTDRSQATIYRHLPEAEKPVQVEPGIIAELDPRTRVRVAALLHEAGWSACDFLVACMVLLTRNPDAMLDRLKEFRPPPKKGRPRKSAT